MHRIVRWGVAATLLPIAACSKPAPQVVTTTNVPPASSAATLASADAAFVNAAVAGGMTEIQLGQLAETNARAPAVRNFGKVMVDQHTSNNDQLLQIAAAKGITPPAAPTAEQQAEIGELQHQRGAVFDREYLANQIAAHRQMLDLFKREAATGADDDLKAFAGQTVPVIEQHLAMVRSVAGMRG